MNAIIKPQQTTTRHLINIEEYHDLWKMGHLSNRVELIQGEIYDMAPIGSKHATIVNLLNRSLSKVLGDEVTLHVQNPIVLNDHSEPEPDICILNKPILAFMDNTPQAEDVLLLIEVSDSTLKHDLGIKAMEYASNGIARYWVIDLEDKRLVEHRKPSKQGYKSIRRHKMSRDFTIELFKNLELRIDF